MCLMIWCGRMRDAAGKDKGGGVGNGVMGVTHHFAGTAQFVATSQPPDPDLEATVKHYLGTIDWNAGPPFNGCCHFFLCRVFCAGWVMSGVRLRQYGVHYGGLPTTQQWLRRWRLLTRYLGENMRHLSMHTQRGAETWCNMPKVDGLGAAARRPCNLSCNVPNLWTLFYDLEPFAQPVHLPLTPVRSSPRDPEPFTSCSPDPLVFP